MSFFVKMTSAYYLSYCLILSSFLINMSGWKSLGRRGISSWVIVTCDKLKNLQRRLDEGNNDDNEDMILYVLWIYSVCVLLAKIITRISILINTLLLDNVVLRLFKSKNWERLTWYIFFKIKIRIIKKGKSIFLCIKLNK